MCLFFRKLRILITNKQLRIFNGFEINTKFSVDALTKNAVKILALFIYLQRTNKKPK